MTGGLEGKEECFARMDGFLRENWELIGLRFGQYNEAVIMTESREHQCPVDTGLLRSTGRVETEILPHEITTTFSYGTKYGLKQHEDLTLHHPPLSRLSGATQRAIEKYAPIKSAWFKKVHVLGGGKAKYLEDPIMELAPGFAEYLRSTE